jgi:hypothetical protein
MVYTQSFPVHGDFVRPNLSMDFSDVPHRNFNEALILSFEQTDKSLLYSCDEYINFDSMSTLNDIIPLSCVPFNTIFDHFCVYSFIHSVFNRIDRYYSYSTQHLDYIITIFKCQDL